MGKKFEAEENNGAYYHSVFGVICHWACQCPRERRME
jgi:hypothetical protein